MENTFEVSLTREDGYRFRIDFGDGSGATLQMDEPAPLGEGTGPNAARVLAAAVGNCLSASLLFCLEKARVDVDDVRTTVRGTMERNERGRIRLGPLQVRIEPGLSADAPGRIDRCLEVFEDFCVVTQSVRDGLEVGVEVKVDSAASEPVAEAR